MPTSLCTRVPLAQWHRIWHFGRVLVCVCGGAVFEVNWVRSSRASVGLWAEGWVSGQDLGTAAQGSASKLSSSGICLRSATKWSATSAPPKPYPWAKILCSVLGCCPRPLVTSSGRIQPLGSLLGPPHLLHFPWPGLTQPSSYILFWTLPSFLLNHQGIFLKCTVA